MQSAEPTDIIIPLGREELRIDRRLVDRGGVRVQVRVEEHDETVDALLSEQSVEIERVAINREIDATPATRQEGDTFIIPIIEEILVVERRLLLKEEVRIRRIERQHVSHETGRVRREVAEIEQLSPNSGRSNDT